MNPSIYTTYQTRPVWTIPINWADAPKRSFSYDLRDILLGQAAPKYQPLANHTVTGLEFTVELPDESVVQDFEWFVDSVKGRLRGFWLASPFSACKIMAAIGSDAREFYIADQRLRDTYTNHSYLVFGNAGGTRQYGRIANCVKEGDYERVTLDEPATTISPETPPPLTSTPVDATWDCYRLLYVRFADDSAEIEFPADNFGSAKIRVVELPEEYAAIETGQQPVFLYELAFPGTAELWRYTNLNVDITSGGQTFTSWPILHDGHRQALEGGENTLKLSTVFDASSPAARFFPYPTPAPLSVKVWETKYSGVTCGVYDNSLWAYGHGFKTGDQVEVVAVVMPGGISPATWYYVIDADANFFRLSVDGVSALDITTVGSSVEVRLKPVAIFSGIVDKAKLDGAKVELECVTMISALGRQFPRFFIQNRCNYCLFSGGCGLTAADWKWVATVAEMGARHARLTIVTRATPPGYAVSPTLTAGFFAFGWLEVRTAAGVKVLVRTIESNLAEAGTLEVVLTAPVSVLDMPAGSMVWIYPGCDGTKESCRSKFFNFANWGGHNLTATNLSINAVPIAASQNKK